MISSGVDRIFVSVRDMDESLAFYRDWVGMEVVAEQHLDSEKIRHLWNLNSGIQARAVFLKNEEQPTMLELIEFQPPSKRAIRQGARHWDYGFYDTGFMVKDLDKTYQDLIGKGFTFVSPPISYKPDWTTFINSLSIMSRKRRRRSGTILFLLIMSITNQTPGQCDNHPAWARP